MRTFDKVLNLLGGFPSLNCSSTIKNETNETQWKQVAPYQKNFQCAQLLGGELAVISVLFKILRY